MVEYFYYLVHTPPAQILSFNVELLVIQKVFMKKILTFIALCFTLVGYSQFDSSNSTKLGILFNKLRHIKYADFQQGENGVKYLISRGANENVDIIAFRQFVIEELKLEGVIFTKEQRNQVYNNCNSISEIVDLTWYIGAFKSDIGAYGKYPCNIQFSFADGTVYKFYFSINFSGSTTVELSKAILRSLRKNIDNPNEGGNDYIMKVPSSEVIYTKSELNNLLDTKKDKNKIEGIYQLFSGTASMAKIGIIKKDDKYLVLQVENKYFKNDWKYGEIRGMLTPTASSKLFTGTFKDVMKKDYDVNLTVSDDNQIEVQSIGTDVKYIFVKIK